MPQPNQRDETDQPSREPVSAPEPEIYTHEREYAANQQGAEGRLPPVHPGEILHQEFLEPLELTAADLAELLRMPAENVESLTRSERPITADDALRLARYFNTTPKFWLNLQAQYDLEVTHERIRHDPAAITPHSNDSDA